MSLYLGIDAGTQSTKAVVYDAERRQVVSRGAVALQLLPSSVVGCAEQDPSTWIESLEGAVRQALSPHAIDGAAIRGIGVSGQQHGFVALDADDAVIRPAKLWCDTETAPEAAELSQQLGRPIPAGFTASKILWLKRHEPDHFARLERILLPHDYLNLYLSGRACMEAGDASGSGLFDPRERRFEPEACAAIDAKLADCLPELVDPDQAIGGLRGPVAQRLGLQEGIPIAAGSGDNMMSALGAGAVAPGRMVMSLGTSGTLFAHSNEALIDDLGWIAPFCDATGAWLPLLCTMNCTTVTEEVRQAFGLPLEELTRLAGEVPAGCDGLRFLPYLAGERSPDWPHASGVLSGLRPGSMQPGKLFRAAIEGATFALREGYARMQELGLSASEIRLVGGGSKNSLWRQIVADVFGVPVRLPSEAESAALGGALQAVAIDQQRPVAEFIRDHGVALEPGQVDPCTDLAEAYQLAREQFRQTGKQLFA